MLIVLDVDGTLAPDRMDGTDPFKRVFLPGVKQKCKRLVEQGHVLAIATNQGGATPGRKNRLSVGTVHNHLRWLSSVLGITTYRFAITSCRRKPNPGMLLELMEALGFDPESTIFVGDSQFDEGAADAAGCRFEWAEVFFNESP